MGTALDDMLPLAVAIAVSPVPVLAVVFMLLTDHGPRNALAFLVGWALTLAAGAGVVAALDLSAGSGDGGGRGVAIAQIVLAVLLGAFAVHEWRDRPAAGQPARPPRWMVVIETISVARALGLGVALIALNPKDGALTLAAGVKLGEAHLAAGPAVASLLVFVAVSSLTVAVPLVVAVALGPRAIPVLHRARGWLERHGSTAVVVTLVVVSIVLLAQGVRGL